MYAIGIFLIYILIFFIEYIPLLKKKNYKDITLYSFLIALSLLINLLISLGITIPTPVKPIEIIVNKLFNN
jgi:hypothetical protein